MYKIKYLPKALKDLTEIVDYITIILCNKKAALDFIDTLDHSVSRLHSFPYSYRLYQSQSLLDTEYRVLPVKNYLVFYVILDIVVEISRIVYARIDLDAMLSTKEWGVRS